MSIVVVEDLKDLKSETPEPVIPEEIEAKENKVEEVASRKEFVEKRKSMDVNEFRRPSLAEVEQEQIDEKVEEVLETVQLPEATTESPSV